METTRDEILHRLFKRMDVYGNTKKALEESIPMQGVALKKEVIENISTATMLEIHEIISNMPIQGILEMNAYTNEEIEDRIGRIRRKIIEGIGATTTASHLLEHTPTVN